MSANILLKKVGKIYYITFNRVAKKNAIVFEMYDDILKGLDEANNDPEVMMTVFTGNGEFYSSGNDFSMASLMKTAETPELRRLFADWVDKLIDHKKLLIALVNGPAIGIAATTLALFDIIYSSTKAYFHCPFTSLALCPEGTSSHTFAKIMGHTKASQMILLGEKLTAHDAFTCGFVSKVVDEKDFLINCVEKLEHFANTISRQSLIYSKDMMRNQEERNKLKEINRWELEKLEIQVQTDECQEYLAKKFMRPKL
uniref:Enoyl-CoA delta isomerase 2, mitochondrial n=1 Tax=Rhabditophanes sp. KR3021 TaxID=114890 RepID=A0AC35TTA8_9BILA